MNSLSKRDRILLGAIVGIGLLVGIFWLWVKPARAELELKKQDLTSAQETTQELRNEITRLNGQSAASAGAEGKRLTVGKPLPRGAQIPGLMIELQSAADRANVKLDAVRPASVTQFGSLRAQEVTVEVSGTFFDVDDFMYRLQRMVEVDSSLRLKVRGRVVLTKKFDISPDTEQATGTQAAGSQLQPQDRLKATFTLVVPYRFNGSEQPGAGATGTATASGGDTSSTSSAPDGGGEGAAPEGANP